MEHEINTVFNSVIVVGNVVVFVFVVAVAVVVVVLVIKIVVIGFVVVIVGAVVGLSKFLDTRKFVRIVVLVIDVRDEGVEDGDVIAPLLRVPWHPVR